MNTLDSIGALLVDNSRSKAYMQYLAARSIRPAYAIIMRKPGAQLYNGQRESDIAGDVEIENATEDVFFNSYLPLRTTLERMGVPIVEVEASDPNESVVCDAIKKQPGEYVIYSGPGGAIVRKSLFETGRKFIHVHSGTLPEFRGSTTIYYEMLATGRCAATAFIMAPSIDTGEVLSSRSFPPPDGINIDYVYDSHCRSQVLADLMESYIKAGRFSSIEQPPHSGAPYYIIHPALKQVALLSSGISSESEDWQEILDWSVS